MDYVSTRRYVLDVVFKEAIAKNSRISDFLSEYKERVISMLNKTISAEEYAAIQYEDGFDEGKAEGRAEGRAEGKAEGEAKGKTEVNRLYRFLIGKGKSDLVGKAIQSEDFLNQLLEKYKGYY